MAKDLGYLYPAYPIISGILITACIMPISAHWRAGNVAITALGLWVIGANMILLVGTIAWHGTINNPYPIWGDLVNIYYTMFPTALASTTLCIQYRLWSVARTRNVFVTKKEVCFELYIPTVFQSLIMP